MDTPPLDDEASSQMTLPADAKTEAVLNAVAPHFMPWRSLALYGRWWQLESWLRDLIYVELRAQYGATWAQQIGAASVRQQTDASFRHMASVDNENPLAYLDYSQLLEVIDRHWNLFDYALLEQQSWKGRQQELKQIRHRIGHVRRPHRDDLNRLEQTLRDLESGAFKACASYNRQTIPDRDRDSDPITVGWIREEHEVADRLVKHARSNYDVQIRVAASKRPWGEWGDTLSDSTGLLWHANFYLGGQRSIDMQDLWNEVASIRHLIVHAHVDTWEVKFTFSDADDGKEVSDAIGRAFDAVLVTSRNGPMFAIDDEVRTSKIEAWQEQVRRIDFRILSGSPWSFVDDTTTPISMFSAGGGVESPNW